MIKCVRCTFPARWIVLSGTDYVPCCSPHLPRTLLAARKVDPDADLVDVQDFKAA